MMRFLLLAIFLPTVLNFGGEQSVLGGDLYQDLVDAPTYRLGKPQLMKDAAGKDILIFSYERTKRGWRNQSVRLAGKSTSGSLFADGGPIVENDSGAIVLDRFVWDVRNQVHLELYLVQPRQRDESTWIDLLVSNVVRLGNPGEPTVAKRLSRDGLSGPQKKSFLVTLGLPPGADFLPGDAWVTRDTDLLICQNRSWVGAKAISENSDGSMNVDVYGTRYRVDRGDLVIRRRELDSLGRHPPGKYPKTIPNWGSDSARMRYTPIASEQGSESTERVRSAMVAVPSGWQHPPMGRSVPPGMQMQALIDGTWKPVIALRQMDDGSLMVRAVAGFHREITPIVQRNQLIIKNSDVNLLGTDDGDTPSNGSRSRENRITSSRSRPTAKHPLRLKEYPVTIPIPNDWVEVPLNAELEPGTKLQACYARKWNPITFLSHAPDGLLNIHWDDYGSVFDCRMKRSQLIIKKSKLP